MRTRVSPYLLSAALSLLALPLNGCGDALADNAAENARISQGLNIAPVHLDLAGKDKDLVGLGSYLVNASGGCHDCHSCPSYTPGHNPFDGRGDGESARANYLAGGVPFGPVITSRNLTPDASGKPAGLTFDEFLHILRPGDDDEKPGQKLKVMPWPVYRNMTERDLRAIYEFLRAIPHADSGKSCTGPGE